MQKPDILALPLERAVRDCTKNGWEVQVEFTSPPRKKNAGNKMRVVRFIETAPGKGLLTVAEEKSL